MTRIDSRPIDSMISNSTAFRPHKTNILALRTQPFRLKNLCSWNRLPFSPKLIEQSCQLRAQLLRKSLLHNFDRLLASHPKPLHPPSKSLEPPTAPSSQDTSLRLMRGETLKDFRGLPSPSNLPPTIRTKSLNRSLLLEYLISINLIASTSDGPIYLFGQTLAF